MARELDGQAPGIDTVLVAVGGGGLIAGVAAWFGDRVRIVSVEPASIPAMYEARRAGRPVDVAVSGLAADSLGRQRHRGGAVRGARRRSSTTPCW